MKEKSFPVHLWLDRAIEDLGSKVHPVAKVPVVITNAMQVDNIKLVEQVTNRIEQMKIDITEDRMDWLYIGLAFSADLGEDGRELFHRVSQFYQSKNSVYSRKECDQFYTSLLQKNKNIVHLGTFFYICEKYGVDVKDIMASNIGLSEPKKPEMPKVPSGSKALSNCKFYANEKIKNFANRILKDMAEFIQLALAPIKNKDDKDMMLLTLLVVLASSFGKSIRSMYNGEWIFCNLYLMVVGSAGSRKGIMKWLRYLVNVIHYNYHELYRQKKELYNVQQQKLKNGEKIPVEDIIEEPKHMMHIIPSNSSSAAMYQALQTMGGVGLIFDTEIDTLCTVFKQDWGNFSELLRKMFHSEPIEIYRKTNNECYTIEEPAASLVLSGTYGQFTKLIYSVDDGLFSRFIFFNKQAKLEWENIMVAKDDEQDAKEYYRNLGVALFNFFVKLQQQPEPITFKLTESQTKKFNSFFSTLHSTYLSVEGEPIHASIVRHAHIAYRIMMVLSLSRYILKEGDIPKVIICDNKDFKSALAITESIVQHMALFYEEITPEQPDVTDKLIAGREDKDSLYKALPVEFTTAEYLEIAAMSPFNINNSTAKKWLKSFCTKMVLIKTKHGKYKKKR